MIIWFRINKSQKSLFPKIGGNRDLPSPFKSNFEKYESLCRPQNKYMSERRNVKESKPVLK